jgi:peptidoglycan biosynthesis protein MviN/MurJ (putative lipid II flippase)
MRIAKNISNPNTNPLFGENTGTDFHTSYICIIFPILPLVSLSAFVGFLINNEESVVDEKS